MLGDDSVIGLFVIVLIFCGGRGKPHVLAVTFHFKFPLNISAESNPRRLQAASGPRCCWESHPQVLGWVNPLKSAFSYCL